MHPQKLDLRKTKEFKKWKQAVRDTNNPEANIIVQTLYTTVSYEENQIDTEQNTETANNEENQSESDTEMPNNNEDNQSESDTDESETDQDEYHDNMLLQIPLENYLPSGKQDKNTQTTTTDTEPPNPFEIPSNNDDFEVFSDERLREIVAELREDPELRNIFADPENLDQEDEGVELRTLEEEFELDVEPFDYRLEVELSNWESQL